MAVSKATLLATLKKFRQTSDPRYAVTVEKLATATAGYAHSYVVKQNGVQVGATIDIPKDFLVKSATVETVAIADTPVAGYTVGQKYLDFVVNSVDNDATASHIYLLVDELVDVYNEGNGIELGANNTFSVKIDATNANGLSVSANGVALGLATTSENGVGGSNGAMSAADKEKLDGIEAEANKYIHPAYTATVGAETADATPTFGGTVSVSQVASDATGHVVSQTTRTITIPNATAVAATSGVGGSVGLMSGADKENLDTLVASANETISDAEIAALFVDE